MIRLYKRTLAFLLIFTMVFTSGLSVYASDISEEDYRDPIDEMQEIHEIEDDTSQNVGDVVPDTEATDTEEEISESGLEDDLNEGEDLNQDENETEEEEQIKPEDGNAEEKGPEASIELELIAKQTSFLPRDTVHYDILIRNGGEVDLENLLVEDLLNGSEEIDLLEIGGEHLLEREYHIAEDYSEDGLYNKVSVSGSYQDIKLYAEGDFTLALKDKDEIDENRASLEPEDPEDLEDLEEEELEEIDQGLEYFPQVLEPDIEIPFMALPLARMLPMMLNAGLQDTIEVDKEAERILGLCRTFEVTLSITGEPQHAPVDVVLVIDRSGSMKEASGGNQYFPIVAEPATSQTYYVKVGSNYQTVTYHTQSGKWRYSNNRYVFWDPDGSDSAAGGNNSSSAVGKPFYIQGNTRLYHAKKAAINFAAKVLGPTGIPGSRVAIVSYAGPTAFGNTGHDGEATIDQSLTSDLSLIQSKVNAIIADGGTNIQSGFRKAKAEILANINSNSNKVVILFTDGMPNASDTGATLQAHENVTTPTIHTNATIAAAEDIFNNGIADVFTVGLFQGMSTGVKNFAIQVLTASQNKGFYDAPTAADLDQIFNNISNLLGYAATNAVVTDVIGDDFNLIENSLPAGASYDSGTRTITWSPGTIYGLTQLKFQVQAKPDFEGGLANTNKSAILTYTDIFGTPNQTKTFPVPNVEVATKLSITLTNAVVPLGQSITLGTGTDPSGQNYMSPISGGDGDGTYTYEWRIEGEEDILSTEKNPSFAPTVDTRYELTVTDSNGCKAVASMLVEIQKGTIKITKIVENPKAKDANRIFDILVTDSNGRQWTVRLKHGQSKTIEGLATGEYTISEILPMNFKLVGIEDSLVNINQDNLDHEVTVTNKRSNNGWFHDEDERENKFKVGVVVIPAILPPPEPVKENQDE